MTEELSILMTSPKATLAMLVVPSMLVGILLIIMVYRLADKLVEKIGLRFLASQDRQAAAFEKIADGVERMKSDLEATVRFNTDIRITLTAMADKVNHIYENARRNN